MQIGNHRLSGNLILAPMAGITDLPFRQLCRRFGASLAVSEMISADTSLWGSRKTQTRLHHEGEDSPIAVQLVGTDPEKLALAARINVDYGAEVIDINMGCPAKKVCKVAAGSALMRDESLVGRILEAVVGAVDVPVSLKMRTGWDRQSINAPTIARIAEESGIRMLSVHGRTRACKFAGEAEYETIREVKQAVSIPVVANGDIQDEKKAKQVLKFTGADAIMIGRAARAGHGSFARLPTISPPASSCRSRNRSGLGICCWSTWKRCTACMASGMACASRANTSPGTAGICGEPQHFARKSIRWKTQKVSKT